MRVTRGTHGGGACRYPRRDAPLAVRTVSGYRDLLPLHEAFPQRYPHLLESVVHGQPHARYDILFAFPGETLELTCEFLLTGPGEGADFLAALDGWWRREQAPPAQHVALPFRGGWFLYLGYELGAQVEPAVPLAPGAGEGPPQAFATRIPAAVITDHQARRTFLVAEPQAAHLLDALEEDLAASSAGGGPGTGPAPPIAVTEDEPGAYLEGVRRIKRYIRDGDVFQVNLSRAWTGAHGAGISPGAVYRRLRRHNPGPFCGLASHGDLAVISSSPERLVRTASDGLIETRPIAGTRPRGHDPRTDRGLSRVLMAHPKERAEHTMLIDLERNDLGRVCRPGSVQVNELMVLESYRHVHHIVSNVRGRLSDGVTPGQVIAAVFPGGTITGCPKIRCMQIIAELEQTRRGPYTGAMGYLNRDGAMDLNILIRTLWTDRRRFTLRTGAGIVADSQPEQELEETRAKAKGLLMALGGAP